VVICLFCKSIKRGEERGETDRPKIIAAAGGKGGQYNRI